MTFWDRYLKFRPDIEKLIDRRLYTVAWLDTQIWAGLAQIWATDDACIVAEIRDYPTGAKEIHGLCAVGDIHQIVGMLIPVAEEWGKEMGCIIASIASRDGWARVLKDSGYTPHQTYLRKELG